MKSRYILVLGFVFFLFISIAQGQKKSDKINETIQNSAKALGDLFHKKKPATQSNPASGATSNSAKTTAATSVSKNKSTGDIGKMSADVKYIDADALFPFDAGAALIRKGSSTGLIDAHGNFIVPLNKYEFMSEDKVGSKFNRMYNYSGIFQLVGNNGGYINSKGKIIASNESDGRFLLSPDKTLLVNSSRLPDNYVNGNLRGGFRYTYITADGKKYVIDNGLNNFNDGIGVLANTRPSAYATLDDKKITGNLFDFTNSFSDGMALVGKKDAYGEMKYGYINTEGKLVIPYQFSIMPGNFSSGYAKVIPRDKSSFEYAFINKKGDIVFKQTLNDEKKYGIFPDFSALGFSFSGSYFLTTDLKIVSKADFFQSYGIPADSWLVDNKPYAVEGEKDQKLYFKTRYGIDPITKQGTLIGFINMASKTVVMPAFYRLGIFDPVSHLAYAEADIGRDTHGSQVFRKGYVNEKGEFVLVQGSGSKW